MVWFLTFRLVATELIFLTNTIYSLAKYIKSLRGIFPYASPKEKKITDSKMLQIKNQAQIEMSLH